MVGDSNRTIGERFYTLLFYQLAANMPRPGGIHKYSKGNMVHNFKCYIGTSGFKLVLSENVDYSQYVMGYKDDGSRRRARGNLEKINFKTVDNAVKSISKIIASSMGGSVKFDQT